MKRTFLIFALFLSLSLSLSSSAWSKTEAEIEQAIQDVLAQRHPEDTPDWWRSLGRETPTIIIRMFEKSTDVYHKLRLVQALAWFDEPQAVDFVKTQAQSTEYGVIRNAAVKTVGVSRGKEEIDFISKFLSHSDIQTRFAAAEALKRIGDPMAEAKVNDYLQKEKAPWVAQKLKGQLKTPRGRLAVAESSESRNFWKSSLGTWKGYLVTAEGVGKNLQPVPALLTIAEVNGIAVLKLKLVKKAKTSEFTLQNVKWVAAGKFTGLLTGASPKVEKIEALITQGAFGVQYTIPLAESGGTLVLRKQ